MLSRFSPSDQGYISQSCILTLCRPHRRDFASTWSSPADCFLSDKVACSHVCMCVCPAQLSPPLYRGGERRGTVLNSAIFMDFAVHRKDRLLSCLFQLALLFIQCYKVVKANTRLRAAPPPTHKLRRLRNPKQGSDLETECETLDHSTLS